MPNGKFHVNKETGRAGACHATKKGCPLGEDTPHFDTKEQAKEYIEKDAAANNNQFGTVSKKKDTPQTQTSGAGSNNNGGKKTVNGAADKPKDDDFKGNTPKYHPKKPLSPMQRHIKNGGPMPGEQTHYDSPEAARSAMESANKARLGQELFDKYDRAKANYESATHDLYESKEYADNLSNIKTLLQKEDDYSVEAAMDNVRYYKLDEFMDDKNPEKLAKQVDKEMILANKALSDNRAAATRASKQLKAAKKNLDTHNEERNYDLVKDNVNNLNREYHRLDNQYWRENDEDVRKEIRKDMVDVSDKLSSAKSAFRKISKNDNLESYIDNENSIRPLRFPNPKDLDAAKLNAAEDHIKRQFNRDALKDRRMAIADVNGGGYGGEQIRQNEDGSYQLEHHAHRQASVVHKSNNLKEILRVAAERNGYNNDEYDPQDAE